MNEININGWSQSTQVKETRTSHHKTLRVETPAGSWVVNFMILQSATSTKCFNGGIYFYENGGLWGSSAKMEIHIRSTSLAEAKADIESLFEMCVEHIRLKAEKAAGKA